MPTPESVPLDGLYTKPDGQTEPGRMGMCWTVGKGKVFYTAIGDRPENWENQFHLHLLAGGIRWSIGDAKASIPVNLKAAAPGYAEIPPKYPPDTK